MTLFLDKWSAESSCEGTESNAALDVMKRLQTISEQLDPNNKSCLTALKVRERERERERERGGLGEYLLIAELLHMNNYIYNCTVYICTCTCTL